MIEAVLCGDRDQVSILIQKHKFEQLICISDEFGEVNLDFESYIHNTDIEELITKLCLKESEW